MWPNNNPTFDRSDFSGVLFALAVCSFFFFLPAKLFLFQDFAPEFHSKAVPGEEFPAAACHWNSSRQEKFRWFFFRAVKWTISDTYEIFLWTSARLVDIKKAFFLLNWENILVIFHFECWVRWSDLKMWKVVQFSVFNFHEKKFACLSMQVKSKDNNSVSAFNEAFLQNKHLSVRPSFLLS